MNFLSKLSFLMSFALIFVYGLWMIPFILFGLLLYKKEI